VITHVALNSSFGGEAIKIVKPNNV